MTGISLGDIDEKTKISLFAVVVAIAFAVPAVLWLSNIDSRATEARENAATAMTKLDSVTDSLVDIRERLIRIEDTVNKPRSKK